MISFMLNHSRLTVDDIEPSMSMLDYLRTRKQLNGTKEGCASGDCGACTVLLGEINQDGELVYKSLNSCLLMVAACHGKHVVTIEALTPAKLSISESDLHPVQKAMVDCHGSQCGFCTPGFVMSLYAMYITFSEYPGQEKVIEYLSGNLCRCTGYRPILEAAQTCYEYPRVSLIDTKTVLSTLSEILLGPEPSLVMKGKSCLIPQNLNQLCEIKSETSGVRLVAGATDLALEFSQNLSVTPALVYVGAVDEMRKYEETDDEIIIGAALPYSQFLPIFYNSFPETQEVFHRLGSLQVRNAGTLGGSLGNASPIGDPAPLLIALGAKVNLASSNGVRSVKVDDFFTGYRTTVMSANEVIVSVSVPKKIENQRLFFYKVSKRIEDDISAVCVAVKLTLDGEEQIVTSIKTGWGGVAAVPVSAPHFESHLINKTFNQQNIHQAVYHLNKDFSPMSDVRASSEYRMEVARNLIDRCWYELSSNEVVRVKHAAL